LAEAGAAPSAPAADLAPNGDDDEHAPVPVRRDNPSWGRRDALVTIVEFADLECPFCARAESALSEVRRVYGPEAVRIVWKNSPLPFHKYAKPAAEAAQGVFELAGTAAFWEFHDAVLNGQDALSSDSFMKWAMDAGVSDRSSLRAGMGSHLWAPKVERDLAEGVAAGVSGTPSFFVNGISIVGAQPFAEFQRIIDAELAGAQAAIKSGTPRSRLYGERTRLNAKAAPSPDDRKPAPGPEQEQDASTVFRIPIGTSPSLGRADAWVTIVEFSDFECPFCKQVESTLHVLWDRYGDKLRLVWKNKPLPFHAHAEPAAELAMAVRATRGNAAFWKFHDKLFESQSDLSDDAIVGLAVPMGLRNDQARKVIAEHPYRTEIEADTALAEDFGAPGTPTFFINGRKLVGAQPADAFVAIVDEEIKKAEGLVAGGTKRERIYDALTKDGKGPPAPATKSIPNSFPVGGPSRGNPSARVTIHEFADYECPFCSRVDAVLQRVLKDYGGKVRLVWHDMPLAMHPNALLAARAAREVLAEKGLDAFWRFHDKLLSNQDNLTRADVDGYANDFHIVPARWNAALDGPLQTREIDADVQAANGVGIRGTPAFLIVAGAAAEGYFVDGAQSYWAFRKVIARALGEEP
jgi:protein-disulfide isomerase